MRILARDLGYYPLALNLAAHYIGKNRLFSIEDYLRIYNPKKNAFDLKLGKDAFYKYTLETVWDTTFEKIEKEYPEALEWLGVCSFLNPDQISKSLIVDWMKNRTHSDPEAEKKGIEILKSLETYYAIQKKDENSYSIHGLLQQAIRKKQENKALENFQTTFSLLKEMGKGLTNLDCDWRQSSQRLQKWWPIQLSYLFEESDLINQISDQEKIQTLNALSHYAWFALGDIKSLLYFGGLGLQVSQRAKERAPEAEFFSWIGNAHLRARNFREAEANYKKSLDIRKELFGEESEQVADCRHNLAGVLMRDAGENKDLKKIEEALKVLENVLDIYQAQGVHSSAAQCLNSIAGAISYLADLEKNELKKEALYKQALQKLKDFLDMGEKIFEKNDPKIAIAHCNIGQILIELGEYQEAKDHAKEACQIQKNISKESIQFSHFKSNLGEAYRGLATTAKTKEEKEDFLEKAEKKHERALEIRQQQLGENNPAVATSLFYLGCVYEDRNNFKEALRQFQKSYEIAKRHYKDEQHPEVQKVLDAINRAKQQIDKTEWSLLSYFKWIWP